MLGCLYRLLVLFLLIVIIFLLFPFSFRHYVDRELLQKRKLNQYLTILGTEEVKFYNHDKWIETKAQEAYNLYGRWLSEREFRYWLDNEMKKLLEKEYGKGGEK